MNWINIMNKKKIYLITILILFLILTFLTPISGDDFGNYISTDGSILSAIKIAMSYYHSLEGRFIGRILIMYTTYHKIIWNILTSLLFTLLVSSIYKLLNKTSSLIILLLGLLLINTDMFAQSYTWLAGSITYLYPTVLTIYYFINIYYKHNNYKIYDYLILVILSIIIPMFVENIACVFVLGNIILLIYSSLKERKLNILYLITSILSSSFLIIMLKSPGSASRSLNENIEFNSLTTIEKIITNIKNLDNYIFFKNSAMLIITIIPILYYLIKKRKIIISTLISIIPILSIINNIYYMLPMKFSYLQNLNIIDKSNNLYLIYWIIYLTLFVLAINYIIKDKLEKNFIYFLLILGISSSIVMLILPTWGDRITLYTTVTLTIVGTILIDKIIKDVRLIKLLKTIYTMTTIYLIICFISINQINKYRENYIKVQLEDNIKVIKIVRNPIIYIWNNNPQSKYFIDTYKSYQNIPKEKDIEVISLSYKDYLNVILGRKKI